MMLPVWLMGLRILWKECFLPIHNSILKLWKSNGSLWLTQYLSEASRIIVLWVNQTPYIRPTSGVRVRLTRSGLPVFLPGVLRAIFHLLRGEDHAYSLKVIRVTLSILSVYRVIGCAPITKLETIIGEFTGACATLPSWEVAQAVALLPRVLVLGLVDWTYMSESAGPNFKKSTWSSGLDAIAFLRFPLVGLSWLRVASALRAWKMILWLLATIVVSLPVIPLLLAIKKFPGRLGKLVALYEARGKVRIVAITDWWTQCLLRPLHEGIFAILRDIPQDGTFDQLAPIHRLIPYVRASGAPVFSYDLSAATDRLPLDFQVQVLQSLGIGWAQHWADLLSGRPWEFEGKPVHYSVGQPIGALSSWAMLALSHHILVQIAAHRAGVKEWFSHYALLGDDIVIADKSVADNYLSLMQSLGVPINLSKSFEMETGGLEFAKRWINPLYGDLSPISPGLVLACVRNPRILSTLVRDSLLRAFVFSTHVVPDLGRLLKMLRPRKWLERNKKPIFSSVFGPTGGLWETASGPLFKAVWISLFPHPLLDKFDTLVEILYQLIADSQKPPVSEEESKEQLTGNFYRQAALLGHFGRGLFWIPLLILSPAFWVYYDLACRADERLETYNINVKALDEALWGREWMMLEGLHHVVKGYYLKRLVKSNFDPSLLDWDRKLAEEDLSRQVELFKLWADKLKVEKMSERYRSGFAQTLTFRRIKSQTIPTKLSLVPLGYRWEYQKITLRPMEIPQGSHGIGFSPVPISSIS